MLYPQILEKYSSTIVANIDLPTPKSGKFLFRLARHPEKGVATYIDLLDYRSRVMLRISRILTNLNSFNLKQSKPPKSIVEISSGFIDANEYLFNEFERINSESLPSNLEDSTKGDHYFIFYTDSFNCTFSGITNPYSKEKTELWQRIINRSFGIEHSVVRRHLRTCNLLVS